MQLLKNKAPQQLGLIGHTIIGYPNLADSFATIEILVKNGVSLIELQIPFSEPIADGPLFTRANHEAILKGIKLADCYRFIEQVAKRFSIPLVVMTYANVMVKQGYENFIKNVQQAGAQGAIVPDLPFDVADDYLTLCREYQFAAIPVVAPNMTEQRLVSMSPYFDGFIYAPARSGVTGSKTELDTSLVGYLAKLRHYSKLPIAVGFGIRSPDDLAFLKGIADYAVIGSETLRVHQEAGLSAVDQLWCQLSQFVKG